LYIKDLYQFVGSKKRVRVPLVHPNQRPQRELGSSRLNCAPLSIPLLTGLVLASERGFAPIGHIPLCYCPDSTILGERARPLFTLNSDRSPDLDQLHLQRFPSDASLAESLITKDVSGSSHLRRGKPHWYNSPPRLVNAACGARRRRAVPQLTPPARDTNLVLSRPIPLRSSAPRDPTSLSAVLSVIPRISSLLSHRPGHLR